MQGRVYITNRKTDLGKIIFSDGLESSVIKLPVSFESGDLANVKFQDNDPEKPIIHLEALDDKWNYGFIIVPHYDKPFGNILPTYPRLRDLLFFRKSDVNFELKKNFQGTRVRFKIKKEMDGKMQAVDISIVRKENYYRCKTPSFGQLKLKKEKIITGFIKNIVKTKSSKKVISGKIIKIKTINKNQENEHTFGFIKRDDGKKDVFFNGKLFTKFYNKNPIENEIVNFTVFKNSRGVSVRQFCRQKKIEYLPEIQQYGFISSESGKKDFRFQLTDYLKCYNKEPEEGDIVYYRSDGNQCYFMENDSETVNRYFLDGRKNKKHDSSNIITGEIINYDHEGRFGFISSEGERENIFFHIRTYNKLYEDRIPAVGESVNFVIDANYHKTRVGKFYINNSLHRQMVCPENTFKNFVHHDEQSLYYSYSSDGLNSIETYRFNPQSLAESISCYKDKNIQQIFRLEAIESLIGFNYSDKNNKINPEKLCNERNNILYKLINDNLDMDNHQTALEYEIRLQKIKYEPRRLSKYENVAGDILPEIEMNKELEYVSRSDQWSLSFEKISVLGENIISDAASGIRLEEKIKEIEYVPNNEKWAINLTN